jgi:outer membrane protein assembly factor BamA
VIFLYEPPLMRSILPNIALLFLMMVTQPLLVNAQEIDSAGSFIIVGHIIFEGNKQTKERIIRRELMFREGDTLKPEKFNELLEKSRENLLNTSLFNFVEAGITSSADSPPRLNVAFTFTERWYIWPWPIIEFADRNFNTWWNENRDLSRMSYGVALRWENFRGRKETLEWTTRFGYNEFYGLQYTIPYLNKKETLGITVGGGYGRTREVPVMNADNRQVYYKNDDKFVLQAMVFQFDLIYRKRIHNTHNLKLKYDQRDYADTILSINPGFIPGGGNKLQYLTLVYLYKSDFRNYKLYPLSGHYFDVEVVKRGLGLIGNGIVDEFYVQSAFRKYFVLGPRWYHATGLNARFTNGADRPYFMDRAIGYGRDLVRGYEYYVVNGNNFGILKNNLKFALVPENSLEMNFIRTEKFSKVHYAFYLNAFFDIGYVDQMYPRPELNNSLENTILVGYGLGIDFVTYYDMVFRFEYSCNGLKEHGFFLHFMAPI